MTTENIELLCSNEDCEDKFTINSKEVDTFIYCSQKCITIEEIFDAHD